jgi:hypothetical protein
MTKIAKAMNIVAKFEGRLPSRKIREKIASQCDMTPNAGRRRITTPVATPSVSQARNGKPLKAWHSPNEKRPAAPEGTTGS